MTETNKGPEPTPAETPTAPMPPTPEAARAVNTTPPTYAAGQPAPPAAHHHGVHVGHRVSEGAIAAMVIGALIFAMLSFGLGWTSRGALSRFQSQRGGMMGQGYGRGGFGGQDGLPGFGQGRRGMMRGYGDQGQSGQGSGFCYGRGQGGGWQGAPNGAPGFSAPNGSVPTTPTN